MTKLLRQHNNGKGHMTPCHPYFDQREQTVSQEMSEADGSTQISIDSEEFTRLQVSRMQLFRSGVSSSLCSSSCGCVGVAI